MMEGGIIFGEQNMEGGMQSDVTHLCAASLLTVTLTALSDKGDELDDGGSLGATIGTQESLPTSSREASSGVHEKRDALLLPHPQAQTCEKQKRHNPNVPTSSEALPLSQMWKVAATVPRAEDMAPTLLTAFLSYTDEIFAAAQVALPISQEEEGDRQKQQNNLPLCNRLDSVKLRLLPSANPSWPYMTTVHQPQSKSSVALSWFLQHHRELAATVMSMGFSFLLCLEEHRYSWKKALEVPLTALQLLANYAHTVSFHDDNAFEELGPRGHLLVMAACLLTCWKFSDIDASVTALVALLEKSFFRHHRVLNTRDILHLEAEVLRVCGFRVEAPRWWSVAIELLATAYSEEKDEALDGAENIGAWWPYVSHDDRDLQCRYEAKMEQLLLTSEHILVFLMNVVAENEKDVHNRHGCATDGTSRHCELRGVLRGWIESSPLFGVALAVASGAVGLEWAASCVGPTAGLCYNSVQDGISAADEAAQHDVYGMVAVLKEVLQL